MGKCPEICRGCLALPGVSPTKEGSHMSFCHLGYSIEHYERIFEGDAIVWTGRPIGDCPGKELTTKTYIRHLAARLRKFRTELQECMLKGDVKPCDSYNPKRKNKTCKNCDLGPVIIDGYSTYYCPYRAEFTTHTNDTWPGGVFGSLQMKHEE